MGPEDNPADDVQPAKQQWDQWEATRADARTTALAEQPSIPPGWDERLPAGVERHIRVSKKEVGLPDGKPFRICSLNGESGLFAAILIEGPSRSEHNIAEHTASIVTCAAILVRRQAM